MSWGVKDLTWGIWEYKVYLMVLLGLKLTQSKRIQGLGLKEDWASVYKD